MSGAAADALAAQLATLDLADSTMILGTDMNGRLRSQGKREMRAIDFLERDVTDPSLAQGTAAVLDKLAAASLIETGQKQSRLQFLTAILEQLAVDNKRLRDSDVAAMNMQLGRLAVSADCRVGCPNLLSGTESDLRSWRQPYEFHFYGTRWRVSVSGTFEPSLIGGHTHWALKEVDLVQVLAARGINLPIVSGRPRIDIEAHHFDVALSFPGEKRDLVARIAQQLEQLLGPNSVFYDAFYPGELAQSDLDALLQHIYGQRSTLVVVVAGADYQRKNWCGLEFRAIKQRIWAKEHRKVMIVRTDDGAVDGIFETDGYVDAQRFAARELAGMIAGRIHELRNKNN